jgi:hypothetical protein
MTALEDSAIWLDVSVPIHIVTGSLLGVVLWRVTGVRPSLHAHRLGLFDLLAVVAQFAIWRWRLAYPCFLTIYTS